MAFASVVRITSARWGRFCFLVRDSARACEAHAAPIGVRFCLWNSCHAGTWTRRRRAGRATSWIVSQPTTTKRFHEIFGRRDSIETGFSLWTWRACSSGLHRKAGLLLS